MTVLRYSGGRTAKQGDRSVVPATCSQRKAAVCGRKPSYKLDFRTNYRSTTATAESLELRNEMEREGQWPAGSLHRHPFRKKSVVGKSLDSSKTWRRPTATSLSSTQNSETVSQHRMETEMVTTGDSPDGLTKHEFHDSVTNSLSSSDGLTKQEFGDPVTHNHSSYQKTSLNAANDVSLKKLAPNKLVSKSAAVGNQVSNESAQAFHQVSATNPSDSASSFEQTLPGRKFVPLTRSNHDRSVPTQQVPSALTKVAFNKLAPTEKPATRNKSKFSPAKGVLSIGHHRAKGSINSKAKRIRFDVTSKFCSEVSDATKQEDNEVNGDEHKTKLSDFAYKEIQHRRHGSKYSIRNGGRVNNHMGLVRVRPDERNTPVCRTFLRGVPCTDEHCLKRHDIPKESAMPICSFFQHQGMCLRGDECPFRHVKVNPRATVCPQFAVLGFCEDKDCVMLHKRPSPSRCNVFRLAK